jgi:hypothetical protein
MKFPRAVAVASGLLIALLVPANLFAMGMGRNVVRSKNKGPYHLVLRIGPAEKMGGMNGEQMLAGKMARCSMKMKMSQRANSGMGSGKCNHHVEMYVYKRASNAVVEHASVHIRLYCIKRKMNIYVPIMTMMAPESGMKDYHYGNNVHTPNALFDVFVRVNGVRAEFKNIRLR